MLNFIIFTISAIRIDFKDKVEATVKINDQRISVSQSLKTKCKILKRRFIVRYIKNRI